MICIVDYGLGNLCSVENMIRHIGGDCLITGNPEEIRQATKLILPGVGAFDAGMEALHKNDLSNVLSDVVLNKKVPVLGICLGMQLMMVKSEEGVLPGLGWIDGVVKKFCFDSDSSLKIPHMGWNNVTIPRVNPLIPSILDQRFYFVHSYHVVCHDLDDPIAISNYGYDFVAAFAHKNIFGVQFHPEKSHRFGMALLKQFLEI